MLNLDVWNPCDSSPPKKRGKYLLLYGRKPIVGGWLGIQISVIEWNGRAWLVDEGIVCVKWKYIKTGDENKY